MVDCDGGHCRRITPCEDPLTDDAAMLSEFDLILLFSLVSELFGCLISMQICTPHAIAVETYIWFEWDIIMFVRIARQMQRTDFENIYSWYKAGW